MIDGRTDLVEEEKMLGSDQAPPFALIYFYCPSKLPALQKCIANPRSLKKPFHLELAERVCKIESSNRQIL
jgi:hypothetical protein